MTKKNEKKINEKLQEELKKNKEELALQVWGAKKTIESFDSLILEAEQKNKNLQEKIDKIEKMNKIMVARELKMIELKKELRSEKTKNIKNQKKTDK
jgi:hypothetical protein